MRILIISDIHGNYNNLVKVIENNKFDVIYLLGDILSYYGKDNDKIIKLLNAYKDIIVAVQGNNDYNRLNYEFELPEYTKTAVDGKVFLLTHGHIYNKYNLPNTNYDVFISGHTHKSSLYIENNKLYLNPGSISLPRDNNKSYAIYDNNKFYIYTIDNILLKEVTF